MTDANLVYIVVGFVIAFVSFLIGYYVGGKHEESWWRERLGLTNNNKKERKSK